MRAFACDTPEAFLTRVSSAIALPGFPGRRLVNVIGRSLDATASDDLKISLVSGANRASFPRGATISDRTSPCFAGATPQRQERPDRSGRAPGSASGRASAPRLAEGPNQGRPPRGNIAKTQ